MPRIDEIRARHAEGFTGPDDIDYLLAEVERLRQALKPFAVYAAAVQEGWPDDTGCSLLFKQPDGKLEHNPTVTLGDCRKARQILEGEDHASTGDLRTTEGSD